MVHVHHKCYFSRVVHIFHTFTSVIVSAVVCRLYVVSVDGVLSALDWEGQQVWSHQLAEPLFSSTLNYKVDSLPPPPLLAPYISHIIHSLIHTLPPTCAMYYFM